MNRPKFEEYKDYAEAIATKYTCIGLELEDIKQEAYIGLLDAISKFDFNKTTKGKFKTYLSLRISGNIKDAIRKWLFMNNNREKVYQPFPIGGFDLYENPEFSDSLSYYPDIQDSSLIIKNAASYIEGWKSHLRTSKLCKELSDDIKRRILLGHSSKELALEHNVSCSLIYHIKRSLKKAS